MKISTDDQSQNAEWRITGRNQFEMQESNYITCNDKLLLYDAEKTTLPELDKVLKVEWLVDKNSTFENGMVEGLSKNKIETILSLDVK